jgi:hypothetical protein
MDDTEIESPGDDYNQDPGSSCPAGDTFTTPHTVRSMIHTPVDFGVFIVRPKQEYRQVRFGADVAGHGAAGARLRYGYTASELDQPAGVMTCSAGKCETSVPARITRPDGLFYQIEYLSAGGNVVARTDVQLATVQ